MEFTRIKPPTFIVEGEVLNEYELEQLRVEVIREEKPDNLKVIDGETGKEAYLRATGNVDGHLRGRHLLSDLMVNVMSAANKRRNNKES